jgi:GNAT superfamily N-acetyltransferase
MTDSGDIAVMVGELLSEIMDRISNRDFNINLIETMTRLKDLPEHDNHVVFIARNETGYPVDFITLHTRYALHAEGVFGTIPVLYVRPEYRSRHVGSGATRRARQTGDVTTSWISTIRTCDINSRHHRLPR